MRYFTLKFLFASIILTLFSCNSNYKNINNGGLATVKERGKLIALTNYNSISYFIYRGTPMGYQYELLKLLADELDVELEIIISNDLNETFKKLENNECDIVAINLTITKDRQEYLTFTKPISQTQQVLVQKKPLNWRKMSNSSISKRLIRNQLDLAGKTIHVMKNSSFADRLKNLENEIGDSINIVEIADYDTEQLIKLVSSGEIEYTISDKEMAELNQAYYPNIDIKTVISFPQQQAWAVNKNNKNLLAEINKWIDSVKKTHLFAVIYNKYYHEMNASKRSSSSYISLNGDNISKYDKYIKKYSHIIDWDWRLLASLIYQESRFNPNIKSWAGAFGLMQLMPATAKQFGVSKNSPPSKNIYAGVKFIKWLNKQLIDIEDKEERQKFILAAYNVGLGHVSDARRLAKANGKNPNIWTDNVDFFLLNKSNPQYYNNKLVKYGYCRGEETYNYVKEVWARYKMYKEIIR
jgi:membrane-bound lytic murein transglycosylase F